LPLVKYDDTSKDLDVRPMSAAPAALSLYSRTQVNMMPPWPN